MKPINISDEYIRDKFNEYLLKALASKTGSYTINLSCNSTLPDDEKIFLEFTDTAWYKMTSLVDVCEKEIGWHGVVERTEHGYRIEDILVFKQAVTGATVTADDSYGLWLDSLDDETFNKLRFHGHSHVRMATNPSSVDTTFQEGIINDCGPDDFYIFGIFNKSNSKWLNIYDFRKNAVYETADIVVITPGVKELLWAKNEIKNNVTEKTYSSQSYYSQNAGTSTPSTTSKTTGEQTGKTTTTTGNTGSSGTTNKTSKEQKKQQEELDEIEEQYWDIFYRQ